MIGNRERALVPTYELRRASNGEQSVWKDGVELSDGALLSELTRMEASNARLVFEAAALDALHDQACADRDEMERTIARLRSELATGHELAASILAPPVEGVAYWDSIMDSLRAWLRRAG